MKKRLNKKKNFLPKIYTPAKSDWYVSFYREDANGEPQKGRFYGDINKFSGYNAKMKEATSILKYIQKNGVAPESRQGSRVLRIYQNKDNNSFSSCVNLFLKKKEPYLRKKTMQGYTSKFDGLLYWLQENELSKIKVIDFNKTMAEAFVSNLQVSNVTKNGYIQLLTSCFSFLVKEKIAAQNPFIDIPMFKRFTTPAAAFEKYQIKKILSFIQDKDPQLWLACLMQYYTFIRPGELRLLQLKHLFLESNKIMVPGEISKNSKGQYVAIPAQLKLEFEKLELYRYPGSYYLFGKKGIPGENKVGVNSLSKRHRIFLKELNFDSRYKFYSWKHTGGAACAMSGIPVKQIQLQMRHSTLEQTDQYLRSLGVVDLKSIRESFPDV